jgi:hypothetical protein
VATNHPDDRTWYSPEAAYWSCIEVNVCIVCACASTLKPLISRIFPGFAPTTHNENLSISHRSIPKFIELGQVKSATTKTNKSAWEKDTGKGAWSGFAGTEIQSTGTRPNDNSDDNNKYIKIDHNISQTFWREGGSTNELVPKEKARQKKDKSQC